MVAEAQRNRAPIQKLADVVSGYFVPIVVGIAAFAARTPRFIPRLRRPRMFGGERSAHA